MAASDIETIVTICKTLSIKTQAFGITETFYLSPCIKKINFNMTLLCFHTLFWTKKWVKTFSPKYLLPLSLTKRKEIKRLKRDKRDLFNSDFCGCTINISRDFWNHSVIYLKVVCWLPVSSTMRPLNLSNDHQRESV